MTILDARSGKPLVIGQRIVYGSGDAIELHAVRRRWFRQQALVSGWSMGQPLPRQWVRLVPWPRSGPSTFMLPT